MMAVAFFLVTVAFAVGLLVNHMVALRDRVELSALELTRQRLRLAQIEQSLATASAEEKALFEADLGRTHLHIQTAKGLYEKELRSYNAVVQALPGSLVSSVASLPATAKVSVRDSAK